MMMTLIMTVVDTVIKKNESQQIENFLNFRSE